MTKFQDVHVAQYGMIFDKAGRFLVLQFGENAGPNSRYLWVLPGGRLNHGEVNLTKALRREIREETGLEVLVKFPFASRLGDHTGVQCVKLCYLCYRTGRKAVHVATDHIVKYEWITHDQVGMYPFTNNELFHDFIQESKRFRRYLP